MNWRVLALAVLPGLAGAEELYRWVDAQGNVHLSETPPEGAEAEPWKPKPLETAPAIPSPQQRPAQVKPKAAARRGPGQPPAASASEEPKVGGRTEADWRREALEKQQKVSDLEDQIHEVEEMPEFSSTSFKKNGYGGKVAVGGSSKTQMLSNLHGELDRARKNLEHFEDYARELGVPAGWLR